MKLLTNIFNTVLYQPLFNALVLLYNYLPGHDFGIAIITLTLLIKLAFYPLGTIGIKSQKALSELQPKIKEIQEKYKEDRQKQNQALLELYRKTGISPFSGCLPLLIQFPILIALYQVFWKGFQPEQMKHLYSFVVQPGLIDTTFLGVIDLAKPNFLLAILTGALQFYQSKIMLPKAQESGSSKGKIPQAREIIQKQMLYFFPIFTALILWKLPSALGLYWTVTLIFSIVQQYLVVKKSGAPKEALQKS